GLDVGDRGHDWDGEFRPLTMTIGSRRFAFVHSNGSFPLTPALSLWERENRQPVHGLNARIASSGKSLPVEGRGRTFGRFIAAIQLKVPPRAFQRVRADIEINNRFCSRRRRIKRKAAREAKRI